MTVEVPAFNEKAAYNPDRPISGLIRTQLVHLHQAESLALTPRRRTGVNINDLHTERQASEYISDVTSRLRRQGKEQAGSGATAQKKKSKQPAARVRKTRGARISARRNLAKPVTRLRTRRSSTKSRKSSK